MILVVEDRRTIDTPATAVDGPKRCSLQQTLRRLGFYAARKAPAASVPRPRRPPR